MTMSNPQRTIVPRGRLWKKQRKFVLERDGHICSYCGAGPLASREAHADHIRPLKAGGEDELWNYVTACETCNKVKSGRWSPDLVVGSKTIQDFYAERKAAFAAKSAFPNTQTLDRLAKHSLQVGGRKRGQFTCLTLEEVDKMFQAYSVRQSANYVAETCKVHHKTARRYVDSGDPARGVEAFKVRLAHIRTEANRKVDTELVTHHARQLTTLFQLFDAMVNKVAVRNPETGEILDVKIVPDFRDIVEMKRLLSVEMGGVSERHEVRHRFAEMSEDELEAYLAKQGLALGGKSPRVIDVTPANRRPLGARLAVVEGEP